MCSTNNVFEEDIRYAFLEPRVHGDRRDAVIDDVAAKRCPPIFRQFSSLE